MAGPKLTKREIYEKTGRDPDKAFALSKEQVEEALTKTFSCITAAAKVFTYPDGREISRDTFRSWMYKYNVNPYDDKFKVNLVEGALDVLVKLAHKGKERSLHKILDTWGKSIGFNPPPKHYSFSNATQDPYIDALTAVDPTYETIFMTKDSHCSFDGSLDKEDKDDKCP